MSTIVHAIDTAYTMAISIIKNEESDPRASGVVLTVVIIYPYKNIIGIKAKILVTTLISK